MTTTRKRKRHVGPDGHLYELEPIKGQKRAWHVLWVHICPECKVEFLSRYVGQGHMDTCSRNPGPFTR